MLARTKEVDRMMKGPSGDMHWTSVTSSTCTSGKNQLACEHHNSAHHYTAMGGGRFNLKFCKNLQMWLERQKNMNGMQRLESHKRWAKHPWGNSNFMQFISCQTLEPEDKEEVGPPSNPSYSNSRVPVWHENSRTGWGRNSNRILHTVFHSYLSAR